MDLLKALRRRWAPAVGLGLVLALIVGSAAWFLLPKAKYTSSSTLYVSLQPKRIMFDPRDSTSDPNTFQRTLVAYIKDRSILSYALSRPEVAGLPTLKELVADGADLEDYLQKTVTATFREGSELLEISLSGGRPDDLATIVNAIVDSYMTLVVEEGKRERLARLNELEKLWNRYQNELKMKRKSLEDLVSSVGSPDELSLALASQSKTSQLAVAESELMRARSDLMKVRAELSAPEAAVDAAPAPDPAQGAPPDVEALVEKDPEVLQARSAVDAAASRYRKLAGTVRDRSDPSLMHVARQWQAARGALDGARMAARKAIAARPQGAALDEPGARRVKLVAQAQVLEGYQEALKQHIGQLQAEIKGLGKGGVDLETERQGLTIASDFAKRVGAEVEAVKVELNAPDRIRVLNRAKPPRLLDDSKRIKLVAAASFGSFALALFGVAFLEFRARRVDAVDDVITHLGIELVGALPALPARGGNAARQAALTADRKRQSCLVESIDATRTLLLHASRAEAIRVVMVTSAVKGEGKTSLSAHLAASLARAGRRTLLIDGDLRRPAVHRLFDVAATPGLCEVLRGEALACDVVRPTPAVGLSLIAAGRCDPMALQALARGDMAEAFRTVRDDYDFVVVDSAPILPVADSLLIGQEVDAVLFSVLRDVSRIPAVHAARERLSVLGVRILGAVLSGVRSDGYHSYEYYYADTKGG
jgi:capsular exopolysaccharide synthesis family protein